MSDAERAATRVVNIRHDGVTQLNYFHIGRPTPWGNPFKIGRDGTRAEVVEKFRVYLRERPDLIERARRELRGEILGCYCSPLPCHGDVLARVAEGGEP